MFEGRALQVDRETVCSAIPGRNCHNFQTIQTPAPDCCFKLDSRLC
jgi:hypothetical protein